MLTVKKLMVAVLAIGSIGVFGALSEDDLVFDYVPGENPATAEFGGAPQGTFVPGNIKVGKISGRNALIFRNPSDGVLKFPVAGNYPVNEGTLTVDLSCAIDFNAVLREVKSSGVWGKQFFIFRCAGNGVGVMLYFDVIKVLKEKQFMISLMVASQQHKWTYITYTADVALLAADKFCQVGFTWRGKEMALLVNGKVLQRTTLRQ